VLVSVGTAEAWFLQPDALSAANQIINIWDDVKSSDTCVFNSLAHGPVTHGKIVAGVAGTWNTGP